MGFIRKDYVIEDIGITLPTAYAQITSLNINDSGVVNAIFTIQQSRDDILEKKNIDQIIYTCDIDKKLPLYKQVYEKAKKEIFVDWEDDIIE